MTFRQTKFPLNENLQKKTFLIKYLEHVSTTTTCKSFNPKQLGYPTDETPRSWKTETKIKIKKEEKGRRIKKPKQNKGEKGNKN
jgi:hypothetical protein